MSDWGFWEVFGTGVALIATYTCGPLMAIILLCLLVWGFISIADWVQDRRRSRR